MLLEMYLNESGTYVASNPILNQQTNLPLVASPPETISNSKVVDYLHTIPLGIFIDIKV